MSIKQFGVLVETLDMSQRGLCIAHNLNKLIQEDDGYDPIVFFQKYGYNPINKLFAMMQEVEVIDFPHPVIALSLSLANRLLNTAVPSRRLFYVMDLEWLYLETLIYEEVSEIYCNDKIELIARSDSHAKLLTECWKEPIAVIQDFNYLEIQKILGE